jgi:ribokinase
MSPHPPRIVVVGSANVDLVTFADRFPRPGETIFGTQVHVGWGGKGANQAVAARLCGADVDMVARVGVDLFGPATIENFKTHGIGADHVRTVPDASSGVAPIFVEPDGQNRIIVVKGANDRLMPADVDEALPLLERADFVILQLEIPIETVYHTIRLAKRVGARSILNPAPGQALDMTVAAAADYVIPNESEAEILSGMPVRSLHDAEACARYLVGQHLNRVIITLGPEGALLSGRDGLDLVPGFSVQTRDTTGAGDAFIGSFAVFLAEGFGERDAISRANLYAALSTMAVGTQGSFVSRQRFEQEWERSTKVTKDPKDTKDRKRS